MTNQSCRTCRHWAKPPGKRALSFSVFPCVAPLPEVVKVPAWVVVGMGSNNYMEPDEGKTCPCWTARSAA